MCSVGQKNCTLKFDLFRICLFEHYRLISILIAISVVQMEDVSLFGKLVNLVTIFKTIWNECEYFQRIKSLKIC